MRCTSLLRPVIAVSDASRIDGAREAVIGSLNTAGVFGRRDRYVSDWDDSGQADAYVTGIGADLVRGHGRLDGPRRVPVTTPDGDVVTLTARHAVGCVVHNIDPVFGQPLAITDARQHQQLRAVDRAAAQHHLTAGPHDLALAGPSELDPDSPRAVEQHPAGGRLG